MEQDLKYKKVSGYLLFFLVLTSIASAIYIPRYNLFSNSQKIEKTKAQTSTQIGEVKASTTNSATGRGLCLPGDVCDYNAEIVYQPICSMTQTGVDLADGGSGVEKGNSITVRKNSVVEPFEITVPQVLLQGSKYVDDSRKEISKEFPVYRDSQHIILDEEARRLCQPGVDCAEFDRISKKSDEPFAVHAFMEVKGAEEGGKGGDGRAVISSDPKLNSACPQVQKAKANPKKSGQYSVILDLMNQPPGEHQLGRSFGAVDCYNNNPNGSHLQEAENFVSCVTDVKPTDFLVSAVFSVKQWLECLAGNDSCEETEVLALRMDALYGGNMKCSKPDCEIRYYDYEKLKRTNPGDAQSMIPAGINPNDVNYLTPVTNPYYITTPCKVRVNRKQIENIKCLWDISPYQRVYENQKAASIPLDEKIPEDFNTYWNNYVMPEVQKRSLSCI